MVSLTSSLYPRTVPAHLRQPVTYAVDLATDTSRIRREFGYAEPIGEDEALRRTIAWERAHPPSAGTLMVDYGAEDDAVRRGLT